MAKYQSTHRGTNLYKRIDLLIDVGNRTFWVCLDCGKNNVTIIWCTNCKELRPLK